jgi:hypothetical protein
MILYRLKNWKYTLDIYQSKVIFKPNFFLKLVSLGAKKDLSVYYSDLENLEVKDPFYFYPGKLKFSLKCKDNLSFSFADQTHFYKRLKLYIDKQRASGETTTSKLAA